MRAIHHFSLDQFYMFNTIFSTINTFKKSCINLYSYKVVMLARYVHTSFFDVVKVMTFWWLFYYVLQILCWFYYVHRYSVHQHGLEILHNLVILQPYRNILCTWLLFFLKAQVDNCNIGIRRVGKGRRMNQVYVYFFNSQSVV